MDSDYNRLIHEHISVLERRHERYKNNAAPTIPAYSLMESELPRPTGTRTIIFGPTTGSGSSGGSGGLGE